MAPRASALNGAGLPLAADRAAYEGEIERLRQREKAHTREADAIAAARRQLPMVEVYGRSELLGPDGPVTLLDAFEGRRQLLAYYFMWWLGHPPGHPRATGRAAALPLNGGKGSAPRIKPIACL
jgi:predicted dithiol-disulfide oxidoreductase (DUF899 family)